MCELWKDIKGSINYQISNRGRIRSKDKTTIRKNGKKITTKGRKLSKKTIQYDLNGIFIKEWNCVRDIERELKISNESISHCCTGKAKTYRRRVLKYDLEGNYLKTYDSIQEAKKEYYKKELGYLLEEKKDET